MNDLLIEARNLTRRFGVTKAVDDVSFGLRPGSVVGLIGPNGAGKTTVLHLVAGLLEPCSGEARFLGERVRELSATAAAELVCVGDESEPPAGMKLRELLDLQADASGRFERNVAGQLLQEMNLAESKRFGALSKGQRGWVLSVLGLAAKPRLLLMDEPAAGLDVAARRRLYDLVRECVDDQESTVVISSHILTDLQRVCDELLLLHHGRLLLHESLEDLRDEVREVQFSSMADSLQLPQELVVLARQSQGITERAWVRGPQIDEQLKRLQQVAAVNMVNLESLYLAMTPRAANLPENSAFATEELATCL